MNSPNRTFKEARLEEKLIEELMFKSEREKALNNILKVVNNQSHFQGKFDGVLKSLLEVSWLNIEKKAAIFIYDSESDELFLKSHYDLSKELIILCDRVKPGHCLCGQALAEKKVITTDKIDEHHHIHFEGMSNHGHYVLPIIAEDKILGVLTLYLQSGHQVKDDEIAFLKSVSNILASLIKNLALQRNLWVKLFNFGHKLIL